MSTDNKRRLFTSGFTIVELLIVIVVIGVLAAITIISYIGVTARANITSLTSDLSSSSQQLKLYQTLYGSYPKSLDLSNCPSGPADTTYCLKPSKGTAYQYLVSNNTDPQTFCIAATKGTYTYKITNDNAPSLGNCIDFGLVLNLDAGTAASYSGSGTTWTDLSGNNNNGTLVNSVGYTASNGGALVFNGLNNYVNVPGNITLEPKSITVSAWIKMSTGAPTTRNIFLTKWNGYSCEIEDTTRRPYFRLAGAGDVYSTDNLVLGNWYQFVGTFEKGVGSKIYLNGALKGSISSSSDILYSVNSVLNIGRYAGGVYFDGLISDVRIYSRPLDIAEIIQNYDALKRRYGL